ncbi:histidine kinase [Actinomyces sp. 186855]|uniref:sensor histidine kinase n=1 Tax=Actinomyces sp. 186855 TaxID=2761164 RepID=UPI002016E881|nr:histidine kinase [Actinomyces sp. 186855]MCL3792789.1 histidine kinase [Actinomyces sp. 186855]
MTTREVPAVSIPPSARRLARWHDSHALLADVLVAVVVLVLNVPLGLAPLWDGHLAMVTDVRVVLAASVSASLVCGAGMFLRRLSPRLAWALVTFVPLVHAAVVPRVLGLGVVEGSYVVWSLQAVTLIGTPVVLATLASRHRLGWAWAACAVSTLTSILCGRLLGGSLVLTHLGLVEVLMPYGLVNVIGTLVGIIIRIQRAQVVELAQRNDRLALAREQAAALASANERSRIAREMHDVVAHSLAVMITMADGAAAAVERNPQMAREALGVLAETGRSALADPRRLVGVLRDDPGASSDPARRHEAAPAAASPEAGGPATSGPAASGPATVPGAPAVRALPVPEFAPPGTVAPAEPSAQIAALRLTATDSGTDRSTGDLPTAPAPESADLTVLVERFTAAGVPVEYEWVGEPLPDDKGLQLTVFRIAQESLTNVLRYAPTTRRVLVRLVRRTGTAVLTVDNDAAPGSTPVHGSGKGLIGMRERAAVYGGTVDAGPTPTGWQVRAVLRWDESNEGTTSWQMPF